MQHNQTSAYHAQSQGVLHQTLESMLRDYCVQMKGDWEGGLPWLLLAKRKVVQEFTGFSPNHLEFGHKVHGLLALLKDNCQDIEPPQKLLDYKYKASETAGSKLAFTKGKIKKLYDRHVEQSGILYWLYVCVCVCFRC